MEQEEKVAILLCTYNGGAYLAEQLDSFDVQTYDNWQVWASDDGSTDETLEILKSYQKKWGEDRLVIVQGPCKGCSRNFLSLLARPELSAAYFCMADQDDVWKKDKIERGVRLLREHSHKPGLYFSRTQLVDEYGQNIGLSPLVTIEPCFCNSLVQCNVRGNTVMINRSARDLLCKGADSEVFAHDWWVAQVVAACGGFMVYDPQPTLNYRQHSANLVGSNRGFRARFYRLKQLFDGEYRSWMDTHVAALERFVEDFTPENRALFEAFCEGRRSGFVSRVRMIRRTGVFRMTKAEHLAFCLAAYAGRI